MSGRANTIGNDLTFLGFEAGLSNTSGINNTFSGSTSGRTNTTGNDNSCFGFEAGYTNLKGNENVFNGAGAGFSNRDGSHNTFSGFESGYSNELDHENTYYGYISGRLLNSGAMNTFVGSQSGSSVTSCSTTTLVGAGTSAANNLTNASAFGFNTIVMQKDNLILGNNQTKVGIGLSGNVNGPQTALEINTTTPVTTGNSGLRFRTLTSLSPSVVSGVVKVLTVNSSGDVILGDIPGSGGSVSACSPGLLATNFITKISANNEICKTEGIYESSVSPYPVGIGVGAAPDAAFKLHMKGDFYIEHGAGLTTGDLYMNDNASSAKWRVFAMHGTGGREALSIGPGAGGPGITNNSLTGVYIGRNAGNIVDDDAFNTFVGANSGLVYDGAPGEGENTFIGTSAGSDQTTGEQNTYVGAEAGYNIATGDKNTFVGRQSGGSIVADADNNVIIGTGYFGESGSSVLTTATNNVFIGNGAHSLSTNLSSFTNSVSIGFNNRVVCENCVTLASQTANVTEQQVGIGFVNPATSIGIGATGGQEAKLYVSTYNGSTVSGYFNGFIYTNAGVVLTSDSMFKDNVQPVNDAISIINQLTPKKFNYKVNNFPSMNLPNGAHYGFIAQEVEAILPDFVQTITAPAKIDSSGNIAVDKFDFKTINYAEFIPVLFSAIKEQQARLDSLEGVISNCCATPLVDPNNGTRERIHLSNNTAIILNQNSPNPFRDKTEITYSIPANVQDATIIFYDNTGKILNSYEISIKGEGALTVYGDDLQSGVYSYTLIIDGKNYQTKRMIKN